MTYYNLTNVTNSTGLTEVLIASNDLTGGLFWLIATIALWIIMTISLTERGLLPAITVSSFITGISGILLILTGLIATDYLIYYILVMALAVAATFVAGKGE